MGAAWRRHEGEFIELIDYLVEQEAHKGDGAEKDRGDVADDLGWEIWQVDRAVRFGRNNPELGIGVSWRPGPMKGVVLSSPDEKLFGPTVKIAMGFGEIYHQGYLLQLVHAYQAETAHCKNNGVDRSSPEYLGTRQRIARRRTMLGLIQGELDLDKPKERKLFELIERVLDSGGGAAGAAAVA